MLLKPFHRNKLLLIWKTCLLLPRAQSFFDDHVSQIIHLLSFFFLELFCEFSTSRSNLEFHRTNVYELISH